MSPLLASCKLDKNFKQRVKVTIIVMTCQSRDVLIAFVRVYALIIKQWPQSIRLSEHGLTPLVLCEISSQCWLLFLDKRQDLFQSCFEGSKQSFKFFKSFPKFIFEIAAILIYLSKIFVIFQNFLLKMLFTRRMLHLLMLF